MHLLLITTVGLILFWFEFFSLLTQLVEKPCHYAVADPDLELRGEGAEKGGWIPWAPLLDVHWSIINVYMYSINMLYKHDG